MEEIARIWEKYDENYVQKVLNSAEDINHYALTFYHDVAEIYDCITRVRNTERNPSGFSLDDAPILGLLTRIWKFFKQTLRFYEENNAEFISVFERPMIEASVIATYLMRTDAEVIHDYRLCSYKDRLRILRDLESGSRFFDTKAGKRLLVSVRQKLEQEELGPDSFAAQKLNRWRLQGKSFFDIFAEVISPDLYPCTYGMMSDSIHGSWNESMDFSLQRNDDGTFSSYPFFAPADIRYVTPTISFTNVPFRMWLDRVEIDDEYLVKAVEWIDKFNTTLYMKFDEVYDDHQPVG
jgi:hypothetical protein